MSVSNPLCPNASCVVLVPVGNRIEPQVEAALRELERRGYPVWRSYGCSAIDFARSRLATQALSQGFQETLWIDSDVLFEPNDVDQMRATAMRDIVAAGVVGAAPALASEELAEQRPGVISGVYVKKGLRELAVQLLVNDTTLVFGRGGGFAPVRYAPCGMLLVRDWIYRRVQENCRLPTCQTNERWGVVPYFLPLVVDETPGPTYLCEDFAFSHRVRQCGVTIWADMRMRLFHYGNYPFGWEDAGKDVERFQTYRFTLSRKG